MVTEKMEFSPELHHFFCLLSFPCHSARPPAEDCADLHLGDAHVCEMAPLIRIAILIVQKRSQNGQISEIVESALEQALNRVQAFALTEDGFLLLCCFRPGVGGLVELNTVSEYFLPSIRCSHGTYSSIRRSKLHSTSVVQIRETSEEALGFPWRRHLFVLLSTEECTHSMLRVTDLAFSRRAFHCVVIKHLPTHALFGTVW